MQYRYSTVPVPYGTVIRLFTIPYRYRTGMGIELQKVEGQKWKDRLELRLYEKMASDACLGQNSLRSCLGKVRRNHVEMWRCHLFTHRDTCVAPSLRRMVPFRSRDGARLLRPSCTASSARLRKNNCACAPIRPQSSTANGTRVCLPPWILATGRSEVLSA